MQFSDNKVSIRVTFLISFDEVLNLYQAVEKTEKYALHNSTFYNWIFNKIVHIEIYIRV